MLGKYTWRAILDGVTHTSKHAYLTQLAATKAADKSLIGARPRVTRPDAQLKAEVLKNNNVVSAWEGCYWDYLMEIGAE